MGNDHGNNVGGGGGQQWMKTADDGKMSGQRCALLMGVEVSILSTHFFVGKAVTPGL